MIYECNEEELWLSLVMQCRRTMNVQTNDDQTKNKSF